MIIRLFFLSILLGALLAQETTLKEETPVFLSPSDEKPVGSLEAGLPVTKLKLDRSKQFIKTTVDVYIPVAAFEDPRVALPPGTDQIADKVKYNVLSANRDGNQVHLKLRITNLRGKPFDYSAMMMTRITASGNNRGDLNPFKGKYQDLAIVPPKQSVVAELYYDFDRPPENVEFICKSVLRGEEVYYRLGF
ncbi:MAG: hypothetical protein ACE5D8_04515 [Fidelibacterota bacterium]